MKHLRLHHLSFHSSSSNTMPAGDTFVPPVAPFRVPRKKSVKSGDNAASIEALKNGEGSGCPVANFIRPDLPSRCTWKPGKSWKDAPHTTDAP